VAIRHTQIALANKTCSYDKIYASNQGKFSAGLKFGSQKSCTSWLGFLGQAFKT